MATSFRQQIRAGCFTVLETFKAANPTLLYEVRDFPPESYHTPLAYVEKAVSETIRHDSGTRQRTVRVNVVIVNKLDLDTGQKFISRMERAGYPVFPICVRRGIGLEPLFSRMHQQVSLVTGPSGAAAWSASSGRTGLVNPVCSTRFSPGSRFGPRR